MVHLNEDDIILIKRFELQIEQERSRLQAVLKVPTLESQKTDDDHESDLTEAHDRPSQSTGSSDLKDAISGLLGVLLIHPVAGRLRLRESSNTINRELASLYSRIDDIATTTFLPLVHAVLQKASDLEIWKQVLQLIASSSRLTPPPGISASFDSTPRIHTSASHQGSEQTKHLLHDPLRDELHDCSYIKVDGFFEKYFNNKSWTQKSKDVFDAVKHTYSNGRWATFPSHPSESAVWEWWSQLQDEHLAHARGVYCATKSKSQIVKTDGESQLDLFVKSRNTSTSDEHDYADVRVIGEHTVSRKGAEKFLQLARYVRYLFLAQPRRQFVHGFVLSHTKLELHVFDRSGTFSMEPFDIHEEPERFIRVICGYCLMSDEELGLDTFIERDGMEEFVTVKDTSGNDKRLQLKNAPMFRRAAIVGRATSCYSTTDNETVVKFSWVSTSKSPTERQLLKIANEMGVKGIPRLIGHRDVVSTAELRSLIGFSKKREIKGRQYWLERQRSSVSITSQFASLLPSNESKKRNSVDAGQVPSKKSRSNSQASNLRHVHEVGAFSNGPETHQAQTVDEPFIDRMLCIQATQPPGRPLAKFRDVPELLRALRDAIKVHQSLFLDGKILHRDISESNIIITDPEKSDGLSGVLIDIELGTVVEQGKNNRTGLQRMTGTLKYMAIEVLMMGLGRVPRNIEHTFRHDLESFFYVLLEMCLNYGWDKGMAPKKDPLRTWYMFEYADMIRAKKGDIQRGNFREEILGQFAPKFESVKELAMSFRDSLFLLGEDLRTGTPVGDESVLYDQVIRAFDKAINSCNS